jgi:hypothetical protein
MRKSISREYSWSVQLQLQALARKLTAPMYHENYAISRSQCSQPSYIDIIHKIYSFVGKILPPGHQCCQITTSFCQVLKCKMPSLANSQPELGWGLGPKLDREYGSSYLDLIPAGSRGKWA